MIRTLGVIVPALRVERTGMMARCIAYYNLGCASLLQGWTPELARKRAPKDKPAPKKKPRTQVRMEAGLAGTS